RAPIDCPVQSTTPMDHGNMDHATHAAGLKDCPTSPVPTSPGQAAFGAIGEVVRILKADPNTDWGKVNVEALRQHLIDMDAVTMHSAAVQRNIAGGTEIDITGTGPTIAAIRRMTVNHAAMLEQGDEYHASARQIPNGVRLAVTAKSEGDAPTIARIRGLGFAGIMTEGDHHAPHHLAIARGEPVHNR
ncbi:MAG TPA: hypothetical protein VK636_06100, partial [Gemmatimonadaceae bacterium]|nr:hypothetical protein [Gemmatimonadaceae bacterium]